MTPVPDDDALDQALDVLAGYGRFLSNGFTSHAPMVAEALCALGRPDAVLPWLASYRTGLLPRQTAETPISHATWRDALGNIGRYGDWMVWFQAELAEAPWRAVLARWLPRLAPAACADATHGLIRTAHAVRALARRETPQRLGELGNALGAWAATYQTLPTPAERGAGGYAPAEAVAALPLQPAGERRFRGSIVSALQGLTGFAPFAPVIDSIDPDCDLSQLTLAFVRVYLANAHDPLTSITFVHGVTSAAALRSLTPHLDAGAARELVRYAWQAGAGLYASLGTAPPFSGELAEDGIEREALIDAVIVHGDDHAIKFTEACLAEYMLLPDPVFLHAAQHALGALPVSAR